MSDKLCDHTSVGMLVRNDAGVLLIERRKFPFGFAPPAGHVDGDPDYETAARRELTEEVGLVAKSLQQVLEQDMDNHCRRQEGTWHHWKVYQVEADGQLWPSRDETKQARWFSDTAIQALAHRTERYRRGVIDEAVWQQDPGLEPVWYDLFQQLDIVHKGDKS